MKKNRGFILLETIVVISVLCAVLVTLYMSFSSIIISVNKKSLYDNTEYIFKTNLVREHLESSLTTNQYSGQRFIPICQNSQMMTSTKCYTSQYNNNYRNDLFRFLGVEAVYISLWNTKSLESGEYINVEATTQNYIKYLDPEVISGNVYRIIVMYKQENNNSGKDVYEYASLRFGSRG